MSRNSIQIVLLLGLIALIATACSSAAEDVVSGNAIAAGEELFSQPVLANQTGCKSCHSLDEGVSIVGPSLAMMGSRAGSTVADQSAEDYLRQSIVDPDAHLVEGYSPGIMPSRYDENLSADEIDNLVAYLLSLK